VGYEHGQLVEPGPYDLLSVHCKVPGGTSLGRASGGRRIANVCAARPPMRAVDTCRKGTFEPVVL
jgi:hypothetical protein